MWRCRFIIRWISQYYVYCIRFNIWYKDYFRLILGQQVKNKKGVVLLNFSHGNLGRNESQPSRHHSDCRRSSAAICKSQDLRFESCWRWNSAHDCVALPLQKHANSNILKFLSPKNENFQIKKSWYFSYFCSKHRLWVLVWTASARRFLWVPTIYVLSRNKKNNVYPCKPQFLCKEVGLRGAKLYRHVFMMIAQSYTLSTFLHHDLNTVERDQCKLPNHLHVEDDILGPVVQSVVS